MKPERGFAEVNGARLYYEVAGSGPPLVFLHGSFLDTRMWDNQVEAFARRLSQRIAHARKVVLPGVRHPPCMEDPEEFNQIVLEFLASITD